MEARAFRVMLVLVAFVLAGTAGGWALCARAEHAAATAAEHAFDAYNRYIDACNGQPGGEEWDLAVRARETLQRASARRDAASEQGDLVLGAGATAAAALVVAFYALRWALTGRLRPWWPLHPRREVDRRGRG
jgi:hypothetical protein